MRGASGFLLRWVLTTPGGIRVQMRRPGVAAAAKVPRLAVPGRSRPALDGHDDAAAEAQLGADELSVLQQTVTHHDQDRPKLPICVACEVHVATTMTPPSRSAATVRRSLKIFPPGASANIRSNWPELHPTTSAPSPDSKRTHGGHRAESTVCCTASSTPPVTTSTSWRAPRPWTSQASPTPTPVPISRTPATAGDRRGEGGQQSAHFDLAGEPETSSGGSLVRGQKRSREAPRPRSQQHTAKYAAPCLAATRPQPAAAAYPGSCPAAARQAFWGMFSACSPPAAPNAGPAGLTWPWSGTTTRSQVPGATPDLGG